jgi:hypothetical protein
MQKKVVDDKLTELKKFCSKINQLVPPLTTPRLFRGPVSSRNFESSLSPRYINMLRKTESSKNKNPFTNEKI